LKSVWKRGKQMQPLFLQVFPVALLRSWHSPDNWLRSSERDQMSWEQGEGSMERDVITKINQKK